MRAAVLYEQKKPLGVEDVEISDPREGEVLVRMAASGVCHSCLHAADGSWANVKVPMVLGDEGAGVVEKVGPGVKTLSVGDHVILSWAPTCGRCRYCVSGRPVLCERRPPAGCMYDGTTRMTLRGQPVYHYGTVATFGSMTVVPENCAIPIRKDLPLDRAALIGCSVTTGVCSVLNVAQVPAGASMAVFGTGGIGLNAIQGGQIAGAYPVIAVDVNDNKLEYARGLGATHVVNAAKEDAIEAIRKLTGAGVAYSIVAVGDARVAEQAFESTEPGGTCVVIGLPATGSRISIDPSRLVGPQRVLRGSSYGSARTFVDFPRLADLYLAGKLKLDELITRRYDVSEANEAFRALAAGEVARGLIVF
ncbi:MAG TPA: Zn-dependent alcohol dehydrogenase [Chloroflexota bacterium]|nr:Zn-dependent alcohol dehydrogenase [Chloroflexota bacterium]